MRESGVLTDGAHRLNAISKLYLLLLGRIPDPEGLMALFTSPETIVEIAQRISASEECRSLEAALARLREKLAPYENSTKILLFGAYGNGNLGDREMPRCVESIVGAFRDVVCFSFSDLRFADYDFCAERKLSHEDRPLNARALALFDGLLIGGGGLLSYTHEPLWDPSWSSTASIPYGLFACGVGTPLDPRLRPLVRDAAVASARDEQGADALRTVNPSSLHCADPILATYPRRARPAPEEGAGSPRRLFVLRAPSHPWHGKVVESLQPGDDVAVFEAHQDFPIVYRHEPTKIVNSADSFSRLVENYDLVVTERYHGAILSLLQETPTFIVSRGAHSSKLEELCSSLGLADYVYDIGDVPEAFAAYELGRAMTAMTDLRAEASQQYDRFFEAFFEAVDRGRRAPSALRDPEWVAQAVESLTRGDGARHPQAATEELSLSSQAESAPPSDLLAYRILSFQQDELKGLRDQLAAAKAALRRYAGAGIADQPPDASLDQDIDIFGAELAAAQARRHALDSEILALRAELEEAGLALIRQRDASAEDRAASRRRLEELTDASEQVDRERDQLQHSLSQAQGEIAALHRRLASSLHKAQELEACLSDERARRLVGPAIPGKLTVNPS